MSHLDPLALEAKLGLRLNDMQKQALPALLSSKNVLVCAPTSSGKSVLFELAVLTRSAGQRFVYLAPVKSLVQQQFHSWSKKHSDLRIAEMTSDCDQTSLDYDLILATPEKWRAKGDVRCLLLDELHLVNAEGRGSSLQAVVTRNLLLGQRVIAVSATVPNIADVVEWLRVPKSNLLVFGQEHRPVRLQKHVLGFKGHSNPFIFQKTLNYRLFQTVQKYSGGGQTIVFCQTQKGTLAACQQLVNDATPRHFVKDGTTLQRLTEAAVKARNKCLGGLMACGVGFHHAGLQVEDRRLVEQLFTAGLLRVLCATSTLAQGVNLPARLVVIKSTYCYRGPGQGYQEYTQIQLQQMMGRAGRTGLDSEGIAVVMTYKDHVKRYESSSRLQTLQSHLKDSLHQTLLTEVALRQVATASDCTKFILSSYLAVRLKKVPQLYGFNGFRRVQEAENVLKQMANAAVQELVQAQLLRRDGEALFADQLGSMLHKKGVSFKSYSHFYQQYQTVSSFEGILLLLGQCSQFQKFRAKIEERKLLSTLNAENNIKLKGAICTVERKVAVLLLAQWRQAKVENWQLKRQADQIIQVSKRVVAVWLKLSLVKRNSRCALFLLQLQKYLHKGLCDFSSVRTKLGQFQTVSSKAASMLQQMGVTMNKISQLSAERINAMAGQSHPFGSVLKSLLARYQTTVCILEQKDGSAQLRITRGGAQNSAQIIITKGKETTVGRMLAGAKQYTVTFKRVEFPLDVVVVFQGVVGIDSWLRFQSATSFTRLLPQTQFIGNSKQSREITQPEPDISKLQQSVFDQYKCHKKQVRKSAAGALRPRKSKISRISSESATVDSSQSTNASIDKFVLGHRTVISRFKKPDSHYQSLLQDSHASASNAVWPRQPQEQAIKKPYAEGNGPRAEPKKGRVPFKVVQSKGKAEQPEQTEKKGPSQQQLKRLQRYTAIFADYSKFLEQF